jgi:3-methyladenine DNA glycosylase AlkD
LAKKKAEIAEEEARVRLTQNEKQKMMEEMERLGQDTEEQLQIEKDTLNDLEAEINDGAWSTPI